MSTAEDPPKPDTPSKKTKGRTKEKNDSRFQGSGTNFRAKLIGIECVGEARGDRMCQDAMARLKAAVRAAGEHKQRVSINVSLEGLKILEEKSGKTLHHHAVHRISFIARDVTDSRAFGYIYSPGDGQHKFFGIKTEKAAEALVLSLRDLFQVVFELKKREVEEAKKIKEDKENKENVAKEETLDRESVNSKDSRSQEDTSSACSDQDGVANLLHLESTLQHIEQGLQQISTFSGPDAWSGVPASPGGWSAGSDSWGTPSTPRSLGPAQTEGSTSSQQDQPVVVTASGGLHTMSTHNTTGGFSTLPHPPHSGGASTQNIPTLPKPGSSPLSTSLPRPSSIRTSSQPNTPKLQATGWATFESPSPPEAPLSKVSIVPENSIQEEEATPTASAPPAPGPPAPGPPAPAAAPAAPPQQQTLQQPQPDVSSSSFGAIDDPFKNDPFFSSTPAVESNTQPTKDDKYAAFSDLSQPSFSADEPSTIHANSTTNPFTDSSVFTKSAVTEAISPPQLGHSAMDAAFSSTPIQQSAANTKKAPELESDIPSINNAPSQTSDVSRNSSFKSQEEVPIKKKPDSPVSVSKPTLLDLSKKPSSQKKDIHSSLGISAPTDPFGDVSPATEEKLNSSGRVTDDPFDTSAVLLPLKRGPFDFSQLKPVSVDFGTARFGNHEDSPQSVPAPSAPPPPLPTEVYPDLPPPTPPPRPGLTQRTSLQKQNTFDSVVEPVPPPIPKRPPVAGHTGSPKLLRQSTIQFPVQSEPVPPPPPPRPTANQVTHPKVSELSQGSTHTLPPKSSVAPQPSTAPPADPFAMTLPHTKPSRSSPVSRARPRPRAKTPANTSSGFNLPGGSSLEQTERPSSVSDVQSSRDSFGKGQVNMFTTFPDSTNKSQRTVTDSPSLSSTNQGSVADPFVDVDPFAQDGTSTDPFSDIPDPFESPEDPFSENFRGELFSTKAVTVSTSEPPHEPPTTSANPDPFAEDPFAKDPFAKDPFDMSSFNTLPGNKSAHGDSTLRTDTSLDASVSLPIFSTDNSSVMHDDSGSTAGLSSSNSMDKKSDPFQFNVFSNDFFKTQLNGSINNNTTASSSWAFNCTTNDLITPKSSSAWGAPAKAESSGERNSPSLHPAPPVRDNDSSNSEIAEAFGDDMFSHQGTTAHPNEIQGSVGSQK